MVKLGRWGSLRRVVASLSLGLMLLVGLGGCGDRPTERSSAPPAAAPSGRSSVTTHTQIAEVSPPTAIQELRLALDDYQPQVKILSPQPNEVLDATNVSVRVQVKDLPVFKNEAFGLGPHLHLILDNQPYQAVYDPSEPIELTDLTPGTHTLRVFASRPWHESFKNEGAYAQTTFHIFSKTPENALQPNQPLLTYSRPQGVYGAEPVMLDFYLSNVPLHLIAQESPDDDLSDWRIRCTVNGESFLLDSWQPIYLKGLKPGQNWVQLELIDDQGNPFPGSFNNTVRLITYEPGGQDTLSQLVRGDIELSAIRGIVDPNYVPLAPEPEPQPEPEILPLPDSDAAPEEFVTPEEWPTELSEPDLLPSPELQQPPSDTVPPELLLPEVVPDMEGDRAPAEDFIPDGLMLDAPALEESAVEETPVEAPVPEEPAIEAPGMEEPSLEEPDTFTGFEQLIDELEQEPDLSPEEQFPEELTSPEPIELVEPAPEPAPDDETQAPEPAAPTIKDQMRGWFNRVRESLPKPAQPVPVPPPVLEQESVPTDLEAPIAEPKPVEEVPTLVVPEPVEEVPGAIDTVEPAPEEEPEAEAEVPTASPLNNVKDQMHGWFNRVRESLPKPAQPVPGSPPVLEEEPIPTDLEAPIAAPEPVEDVPALVIPEPVEEVPGAIDTVEPAPEEETEAPESPLSNVKDQVRGWFNRVRESLPKPAQTLPVPPAVTEEPVPDELETPIVVPEPVEAVPGAIETLEPATEAAPEAEAEVSTESPLGNVKDQVRGWFNRVRESLPKPAQTLPVPSSVTEEPVPDDLETPIVVPEPVEEIPGAIETVEPAPETDVATESPLTTVKDQMQGWLNRMRESLPNPAQTLPTPSPGVIEEEPIPSEPEPVTTEVEQTEEAEDSELSVVQKLLREAEQRAIAPAPIPPPSAPTELPETAEETSIEEQAPVETIPVAPETEDSPAGQRSWRDRRSPQPSNQRKPGEWLTRFRQPEQLPQETPTELLPPTLDAPIEWVEPIDTLPEPLQ